MSSQKLWRIHSIPFIFYHLGPLHLPHAHHELLLHQYHTPGDKADQFILSLVIHQALSS